MIREKNANAVIITTPLDQLGGSQLLEIIEKKDTMLDDLLAEVRESRHHDGHGEECCGHHHGHDEECHEHHHDHDEEDVYKRQGDGLSHVSFGALSIALAMGWSPLKISIPVVVLAAFFLLRITENSRIKSDAAIALISASALALGIKMCIRDRCDNIVL